MDANTTVSLISTLGFPIVCCFGMAWYIVKRQDKSDSVVESLKETVSENTTVMRLLIEKLGGDK
jgi:preprotein translocase subunit YajC